MSWPAHHCPSSVAPTAAAQRLRRACSAASGGGSQEREVGGDTAAELGGGERATSRSTTRPASHRGAFYTPYSSSSAAAALQRLGLAHAAVPEPAGDGGEAMPPSLPALLEAVAAEMKARWRRAAAGQYDGRGGGSGTQRVRNVVGGAAEPVRYAFAPGGTPKVYLARTLKARPERARECNRRPRLMLHPPSLCPCSSPLQPADAQAYKAAGLLPYTATAVGAERWRVDVLLARQGSGKARRQYARALLLLGGKREPCDASPLETALREAREESQGVLGQPDVCSGLGAAAPDADRAAPAPGPVLWQPAGQFALFLLAVTPAERDALGAAFARRSAAAAAAGRADATEVSALEWVPLADVLSEAAAARRGVAAYARTVVSAWPLVSFFCRALDERDRLLQHGRPGGDGAAAEAVGLQPG